MRQLISALVIVLVSVMNSHAQSLPELPPEEDPSSPPLGLEELLPDMPHEDEALPDISHDKNAKQKKQEELNRLFATLKRTVDNAEAAKISRQIQGLWSQSGSDTVDLLMQWAEDGLREQDYAKALDFLDNVVALQPDFSEGWLRRAAAHIQMNDIALAMLDINKALEAEPRNYNAMALLGSIMEMTERPEQALKVYEKALALYPQMQKVQIRIGEILEEKTDRAI